MNRHCMSERESHAAHKSHRVQIAVMAFCSIKRACLVRLTSF